VRAVVESVEGDLRCVADPPVLAVSGPLVDRTRFGAAVRLPHRASLDATFQLELDGEVARLRLPEATLGFADHPDAALRLAARAEVRLDLDTPDLEPADRSRPSWR